MKRFSADSEDTFYLFFYLLSIFNFTEEEAIYEKRKRSRPGDGALKPTLSLCTLTHKSYSLSLGNAFYDSFLRIYFELRIIKVLLHLW